LSADNKLLTLQASNDVRQDTLHDGVEDDGTITVDCVLVDVLAQHVIKFSTEVGEFILDGNNFCGCHGSTLSLR
jgi:hypothetical protein